MTKSGLFCEQTDGYYGREKRVPKSYTAPLQNVRRKRNSASLKRELVAANPKWKRSTVRKQVAENMKIGLRTVGAE